MKTLDYLLDDLSARLRSRGERMTRPRQLVLGVLAENEGHLSADEILALVNERDISVHRASVYRTLEALCDLDLVQHVHVSHGATLYHLSYEDALHVHLQCRVCGIVTDAPPHLLRNAARALDAVQGFKLDLGHVALSGLCVDCRK